MASVLCAVAKDAEQEKQMYDEVLARMAKRPPKPLPPNFVSEWKEVTIEEPKDEIPGGGDEDSVDPAEKYGEIRFIPLENCMDGVPNMPPPPDTNPDLLPPSMRPPPAPEGRVL